MTDQTKEQTPDIEMIKKARAILDKTPEPHHEYAFFAGQEWVSKEAHKEELAIQKKELLAAFEDIIGEEIEESNDFTRGINWQVREQRQKLNKLKETT